MRERARLAGGDLSVESEPGEGCVISAWVPAGAPARQRETPEPPPSGTVGAAVEGFTWQ
jgi:signal transduction histidine kinase